MARDDFDNVEFGDSGVRNTPVSPIRDLMSGDLPAADGDPNWWSLRTAAEKTGVPISTIRGWYRRGRVTNRKVVGAHGPQVELLAGDVDALASLRTETPKSRPAARKPSTKASRPKPTSTESRRQRRVDPPVVPEGSVLIPVDSWQKMLNQLGNLHEAGQQLAVASERAAKAETEAMFLRERIADMRFQISELKGAEPEAARPSEALPDLDPKPAPESESEPDPQETVVVPEPTSDEASLPSRRAVLGRLTRMLWRSGRRS